MFKILNTNRLLFEANSVREMHIWKFLNVWQWPNYREGRQMFAQVTNYMCATYSSKAPTKSSIITSVIANQCKRAWTYMPARVSDLTAAAVTAPAAVWLRANAAQPAAMEACLSFLTVNCILRKSNKTRTVFWHANPSLMQVKSHGEYTALHTSTRFWRATLMHKYVGKCVSLLNFNTHLFFFSEKRVSELRAR